MADDGATPDFDKSEIQKLLLKAKDAPEPFGYAFGLGASPETCALILHMRKSPEALKGDLKKVAPKVRKVSFGTFTIEAPEVRFLPAKPAKGMIKQLRVRFRDEGLGKYKPILVGPDGQEIDEDSLADDDGDEDQDATAAADNAASAEAPEAPPAPDFDLAPLKARLAALKPRIEAQPKDRSAPLIQAFTRAIAEIRAADAEGAERTIGLIEAALARLDASAPPAGTAESAAPKATEAQSPKAAEAAAAMTKALGQSVGRIRALPQGPAQQAFAVDARAIQALIASGDLTGALAALRSMGDALTRAESGETAPKAKAMSIWQDAKAEVDAGITQLQSALRGLRHPATDRIAEFGLNGLSSGGEQTRLMTALFTYDSASGEARAPAARLVTDATAALRASLGANKLVPLIEANPFNVKIALGSTLTAALDRIDAAVAA